MPIFQRSGLFFFYFYFGIHSDKKKSPEPETKRNTKKNTICVCRLKIFYSTIKSKPKEKKRQRRQQQRKNRRTNEMVYHHFDKNDFVQSIWSQLNIYSLYEQIIKIYHLRCAIIKFRKREREKNKKAKMYGECVSVFSYFFLSVHFQQIRFDDCEHKKP